MGYDVDRATRATPGVPVVDVDIVAKKDGDIERLAEVRWTHRPQVYLKRLREWAAGVQVLTLGEAHEKPLLIVSGSVEGARRQWAEGEFGIEIWDRDDLLRLAEVQGLLDEFRAFFLKSDESWRTTPPPPPLRASEQPIPYGDGGPEDGELPTDPAGEGLISRLEALAPGTEDARKYERLCLEIISYLFGDGLVDPRPQQRSEDGLSIMDAVFRVKSTTGFWSILTRDFRARVIVFECKNYTKAVGPEQVYTTERYMTVSALRPVCFVLSRQGAHEHAMLAAAGALRESGKLMIFLSDADLAQMLRVRDAQLREERNGEWEDNGPTVLLDQKIYDFLAQMPR